MNLREPEKQILDDFEHKVTNKIQLHAGKSVVLQQDAEVWR